MLLKRPGHLTVEVAYSSLPIHVLSAQNRHVIDLDMYACLEHGQAAGDLNHAFAHNLCGWGLEPRQIAIHSFTQSTGIHVHSYLTNKTHVSFPWWVWMGAK